MSRRDKRKRQKGLSNIGKWLKKVEDKQTAIHVLIDSEEVVIDEELRKNYPKGSILEYEGTVIRTMRYAE